MRWKSGKKARTKRKGKWGERRDGEGDVVHVYVALCNMKQSALLYQKLESPVLIIALTSCPLELSYRGLVVEIHPLRVRAPLSGSDFSSVSRFDLFLWMLMQH